MTARGSLAALPLALLLAVGLAACGDDPGSAAADPGGSASSTPADTPTDTPSTAEPTAEETEALPDWPACSEVWVAGAKLPVRYHGCLEGDQAVKADNLSCSSGQRIVRHEDRFFGVAGGKIYQTKGPLEKDKEYLDMVRTCRG